MSCNNTIEVNSPVKAIAQIQRWTITSDDIYLMKFREEPPQWLEDMIVGIIEGTGLVTDLDSLEDRFNRFEQGYTEHFYDWIDGDDRTLLYVQNQYVSNGVFNSGIQEIKTNWVKKDEAGAIWDNLMGAWMTGVGGAWFNERVSVVSNVAYAAAKSASTLTATMKSQKDQLDIIAGDIAILEKQVDGKVETFKSYVQPTLGEVGNPLGGPVDPNVEPYKTWLANGTLIEHTGDTLLYVEKTSTGSDKLIATYRFTSSEDSNWNKIYNWDILTDDLASQAYQAALDAGILADGKINTYYQPTPPDTIQDPTMGEGDLWIDSDDGNKMYRYNGTDWIPVRDTDITASVKRLDEATVTIDGHARAKGSLTVDADGVTSGYVAEADNSTWSTFNIYADKFYVSASPGQNISERPFTIDTNTRQIKFNGKVEFSNIDGADNILMKGQAAADINTNTTTIDGGKITTNSLNANRILANTIWTDGVIESNNFKVVGGDGFRLKSSATSTYEDPDIYGAYIRGGYIRGTTIEGTLIKASTMSIRDLQVITDAGLPTSAGFPVYALYSGSKDASGRFDVYAYNASTANNNRRFSSSVGNIALAGKVKVYITGVKDGAIRTGVYIKVYRGSTQIAITSFAFSSLWKGDVYTIPPVIKDVGGLKFVFSGNGENAYLSGFVNIEIEAIGGTISLIGEGELSIAISFTAPVEATTSLLGVITGTVFNL